ncbi:MAG: hypothetical protein D6800_09770, partial [Candidatus Zixiibacteriota bacterium]
PSFFVALLSLAALARPGDPARAEVTVQLAVPGDPASQPVKSVEITASRVDSMLGNSTFSRITTDIFDSLALLREDAKSAIGEMLLSDPRTVSIKWMKAQTDPLAILLRQASDGIDVKVSGIVVTARVKADEGKVKTTKEIFAAVFCPTIKYTVEFRISALGKFRASDLMLQSLTVPRPGYQVTNVTCSGLLGPIGKILDELFFTGVGDRTRQGFARALQARQNFASLDAMISLGDLVAKLDQAVPAGPVKDRLVEIADRFLLLAAQPASLQLRILLRENVFGPGGHLIRLEGGSIPPDAVVTVDYPLVDWFGGTAPYDVYLDDGQYVHKVATTSASSWVGPTNIHTGTRVLVVSTNPIIPGLKSFPAEGVISFVPGGPDCPRCVLR